MEFDVRNRGDKVARAVGASIWQEAGKSYFPKDAHFMEDWRSEIYKFPKARNDDQVDNYSMVCMIVRMGGMVDESAVNAMMEYAGY
jgi:predicted phage terminase large subunit-like protein